MPNNNPKQNKQEFTFAPEFQKNFKPGTLDTFGEEGIVHSSFGNSDFGDSKYDVDTTPSEFITNNDYQYLRGEKQTYADKAANGIGRALIKTGTRTLNGIVSPLYGAVSALYNQDASKIWDNKITEMSADIESSLDEALPLYKTKKEEDAHGLNKLLYANTLYGDVLDGISYSASALGSGYTTGALLNLAGKLSVVNKAGEFLNGLKTIQKADDLLAHVNKYEGMVKVIDGTKKGLQLYSSASTEASIEGYQAANEWYDSMKNELTMGGMRELTPEEDARLKELRKQVGNTTFAFNLPVIMADNAISFGRAMLGNKVTNDIVGAAERTAMTDGVYSQAKQSLVTRLADKTYGVRKFGVPMVSEGNQEMLQYAVQKGSQDYYNKKYYNPTADDFISSMREGLYEAYGTKEGWDQGLIGALSSGIFSNATVLKTEGVKGFKNPNNDEAVNKAVDYLNSVNGTQAYKDLYQSYVRHSNLADEQDAALENKDTFNYYNATSDMFLNYVTSRIKTGKINDLRTDLEAFKKITPEQLKQQGIELSDSELTGHKQSVVDYVQTRLAKVADIEKLHNNINDNYSTAPEGVKERLVHAAWSLDDSNKRIKELTENASILARKSNSTADISLINILHDYANLPKDNRQSAKDAIANNPLASPHIQDELLAKLKDVDLLIDRRQEFIEAYKELKEPTKQAEVAEQDKAFESQVEEVLSRPTPTEETGETKEQAEEVLTTKAEKPKPTNQPFELDLNDLADISSGELPQFDNEGNEIVSTTEKTPVSEVDPKADIERRRQEEKEELREEIKNSIVDKEDRTKRNVYKKDNKITEIKDGKVIYVGNVITTIEINAKGDVVLRQPGGFTTIGNINEEGEGKIRMKIANMKGKDAIFITKKEYITEDKINAKYDAELKALEQPNSELEAKKADIEKRRQEELEKKVQILKDKRNALRGEDGVVPKENIAEWQQLGKDVIEAQNKATRGNNEGFIPIRTEKDGVLSGEDAINAENEIERVIQKIIKGEITIEQAVSFIHNKYKVLANENGFLLNYINDRTSNAPEIGNNKQSFPAWRKGKYDAELAALNGTLNETEEPIARAKTPTNSNPREIYPGLNNKAKRNEYKLPSGDTIRSIVNGYLDKGIDINTKISLRHFVNSAGKDGAIISINTEDGAWIDLGNLSSYTKDDLTNDVISILTKEGKTLTPQDLGIYFSMTEKTIQLEDKDTKQPNLSELTTDIRVNGEYLIYDRNNGGWANASYDDSNLEIPVDFEEVDTFNKAELNNSRYVLLVPNGNKYSYVRLRNELLSPKDITSLFNEFKSKAVEFKNNKDLTIDEINNFNEAIESQLFIALNPSLKVGQSLVDGSELKFKVGKFGKFQVELRYKLGKDYKSITEYFNITDVKDIDSLLALVNKEFKDKHETDLNLKPNDLQQHVDLDKPETFRAATKPNVFNPNYGNQLVFNELNIEEQPTLVQIAKAAEPQIQDNTLNEDTTEDEDDFDIDNIVYSIGEDKINYTYKAVDKILNNKSKVNGWLKQIKDKSQFWDKVQKDLAIPKDQTDLLKMVDGNTVDEIITNFLADYSYVVKVDVAKDRKPIGNDGEYFDENGRQISQSEFNNLNTGKNAAYYANLTVPGGTNYTENEISTPGITPSIKGHAQFSTNNGIGWFRSDEQTVNAEKKFRLTGKELEDRIKYLENVLNSDQGSYSDIVELGELKEGRTDGGTPTKTRRILELQSDLFQKGRDNKNLLFDVRDKNETLFNGFNMDGDSYVQQDDTLFLKNGEYIKKWEYEKAYEKAKDLDKNITSRSDNQFLQLLNKDSNWVTFFVKSIIQDSAKKGYEKVLFPSGNTASKVEGHTTLEEFIKQKENRIKTLENDLIKLDPNSALEKDHNVSKSWNNEITQLKEELEKVKTEGISKLKPIYDFYENKVSNILSKVYGKSNVKQVTDEYGNTWNEITIDNVRDLSDLAFKTNNVESVDAISQAEIESIKKILPSFIDIQDIETIIKNLKVNGIPYGAFRKNIIYLNSKAKKGTGYHEAFHAVFRTVLSEQDIQKYLKAAKNEFKGDLKASKEKLLLTNPANSNLTDTQLEELVYEEYMADKFADYMLNKSDKSIGATLKQLFRKIIELFKGLFNNTDSTTVLFDKINAGAFVNSTFQFNRFNGNDTAFKLLPRSYSKTVGLQYFTSTESRLLINTLTAKVHNAILNGDTRTRTEIFDDLAKQRFDELENDGIAWVDKLSEKGETQLAEKVASAIEDQQFVLDPESLKGKALGLLKSEVLKRLELFNYVEKDIDSSEDAEDGDDMIDNDANEIKEQLGSKDAWLTGGHDSLSKTIKQYIAFTTYTKLDPLTGKQTEFGVDEVTLYNGLTRILSDTKEDNMLNKLSLVAESNDNIKAFLDRISKEMNITKNEDGTYNIDNINPEAYNTFRLFISNFKKSKASQLMTTYATGNAEEYKVFNANTNDPKKVSRDQWFNALHYIKENNKLTPKQLGDYVKDANKALVIGNNPKELKFLTENDLNTQATDLVRNLSKIGIEISKVYAKYSIVRAKQDAVNEYNAKNDNKILPTSVISDKSINLLSLYNVTPITSELLVGNNGFNLSALLAKNENPYNSDNDINSKLEEIADSNSYFDESIGNSSFTNAEGNRVYEIINLSYVLDKVNDFKSDDYWNKVRTGKGLTEVESKNFKFISGNYLLNKHYDALKRIELNIINGFRNEADTEGITFGSYDQRTYFANALALFGKTTKGGLVRYIFRQNEASSTAYTATGPKINALNIKGGLTTEVLNAFYDKFLSEFNRITTEYADKDNKDKQLIKGYNDSIEKGRAYRFTEFSYLAFINPKLYNDLTRMAQEGNLEELKVNEGKVKNAIEYYLLQEGFARFKEQLDLIGFNTKDNSFVSKNLIAEYGDMDKALKEFYINDYLMSSSINELLDGDYALSRASKGFKTIKVDDIEVEVPKVAYGIDISKRNKGGMASGPDYGKGNHKVTYIKDINGYIVTNSVDGSFIRVTEQDGRLIGDNGVEYTKDDVSAITTNDAQSYASQYHHIFGSMRLGRLDKRAMNIYKNLIQFTKRDAEGNIIKNINIPEVDQEYLEKSMASANSKKTITFDGIAGIYHKLSEAGLWRSSISYIADEDVDTFVEYTTAISDLLFKDRTDGKLFADLVSELADLYKPNPGMEALHSLANKMDKASIDQAITESASKGATVKPQDMFTGDLDASSTLVRNNAKRLQTETPTGKDLITAGSQLINLIDTELDDTYEIEGYGTLGDIRDRYRTLMSESRDNSFKQAMKYIEMFADGSIDITKLREKLVRSLEANNADESMMELFDKGYNLNLSAIIDKAEQIVLAHFSKGVLNQKVNGTKVSLMSDAGITVVRNEDGSVVGFHEVARNPEKYKDYNKSSLRYNVKDDKGRRFSECMLSERILTKHGLKLGDTLKYEDIKMYPELFEAIGYRIPTQGHQSMMALKIVGLLPNYYEGVGIFPMEIIYLSGADFDIDSEFIQLPQFWIRDGRPVAYGTEKTDKDKLKALKYYNLNYNKEFKAEYKKQLKAVVEPNKKLIYESVAKLFDIPTDIKGLQTYKTNAEINNEALRLMIVMLTNDYVQNNSANSGTTTDPMAEVSDKINELLEIGSLNSKYKVPDDYKSASDINGKSISNAKNSACKAGIGIVANKVQQLTLLLKNNNGKGTPLLGDAFRWSIGGKESNGYMTKVDDNRVMDIMGVLLNVMTDNAKDPIAGNMNLSLELLNGYTEFLAQGADKYDAALVLNQPSVQLYGKLKQIPNYTLVNSEEESLNNAHKIFKAAIAKTVYGSYDKATLNDLDTKIFNDFGIYLNNPKPLNLEVKQMEGVLKNDATIMNNKTYQLLQVNALIQFRELEKQADDISNLNTYLKLNQGLDIAFAELRHNLEKAYDRLSTVNNPRIHADVLPLVKADALTYGNIKRANEVLKLGGKIFIEQSNLFRQASKGLDYSLNDSYLNKKKNVKKVSRDFLSYVSTASFKKYLNDIIANEPNETKRKEAETKLKGLNYALVYPELGTTIAEQLNTLKNSDKSYIRNNALIKYLKPVSKQDDKKGIDFIDGKSFAKESPETISTLVDGFKELMFNTDDATVQQFAINLFNYSIVKDNLQFKFGSIMKYLAPGMFHTYSSTLDSINNALNTNDNNSLSDFGRMGYEFRKLFVTYIANKKNVTKYKSVANKDFTTIEGNNIKFNLGSILNDEKLLKNANDIFDNHINSEGKYEGFDFPQFYTFNGNVYELKEVNNFPHNILDPMGNGYRATYNKLEYHGNTNVSPYSNNTYEDAIRTDKQIADFNKPVKATEVSNVKQEVPSKINIYAGTNENAELSNFAKRPFDIKGQKFDTVEGAFQAAKLAFTNNFLNTGKLNAAEQSILDNLRTANGPQAKSMGRHIVGLNVNEWDKVSSNRMLNFIRESFKQNPDALSKLLDTGNAILTHTQDKGKWGTEFPRLLMQVRDELKNNNVAKEASKPNIIKKNPFDLVDPSDLINFVNYTPVTEYNVDDYLPKDLKDEQKPINPDDTFGITGQNDLKC